MTYMGFLLIFLVLPIAGLLLWSRPYRRPWLLLGLLSIIALLYTTLWDNYLVASKVWWYDPEKVLGVRLGWVPLEEYLFFLLQPVLAGLWTWMISVRSDKPSKSRRSIRWQVLALTLFAWALALILMIEGSDPTRYLALILVWALPPIALQLAYGANALRNNLRLVGMAILPPTLFLAAADAIAIDLGIWTINPDTSLGVMMFGVLPIEEFLFFLVTNVLIAFTVILVVRKPIPQGSRLSRLRIVQRLSKTQVPDSLSVRRPTSKQPSAN